MAFFMVGRGGSEGPLGIHKEDNRTLRRKKPRGRVVSHFVPHDPGAGHEMGGASPSSFSGGRGRFIRNDTPPKKRDPDRTIS